MAVARLGYVLPAFALGLVSSLGACAGLHQMVPPAAALESPSASRQTAIAFKFRTLDDKLDPRFNELLGINNLQHIVGYYGKGSLLHPNRGYVVFPPFHQINYKPIIFPLSVDTQATGLNSAKTLTGFYRDLKGGVFGFTETQNIFSDYQDPKSKGDGTTTELFGINDSNIAVGLYTSTALRHQHAFQVKITTGAYKDIVPPNAVDTVATGINGKGDIAGYVRRSNGTIVGFLLHDGAFTFYSFPHATSTEFLGITILDRIVGTYVDKSGKTHGFLLLEPLRPNHTTWQSIDDPNGVGTTSVTSINIHYDVVGYYVDRFGKTHGFLATPT